MQQVVQTLVTGPLVGSSTTRVVVVFCDTCVTVCCARVLLTNGVMLCETPSAKINCSRSSTFVRPLANYQNQNENAAKTKINMQNFSEHAQSTELKYVYIKRKHSKTCKFCIHDEMHVIEMSMV